MHILYNLWEADSTVLSIIWTGPDSPKHVFPLTSDIIQSSIYFQVGTSFFLSNT